MNAFTRIFTARDARAKELHARMQARDEALRAIQLCDRLAKEIPEAISEHQSKENTPSLHISRAAEDIVDLDFITAMEGLDALRRLEADLPLIRTHWVNELARIVKT